MPAAAIAERPTMSQASGRQRGDGRCPVGKTRRSSGTAATSTTLIHSESHAANDASGSTSGDVCSAYVAYSLPTPPITKLTPTAIISQPVGLPGVRDATMAPTVVQPIVTATASGMKMASSL
jgi:hypothetical protein